jgi:hypothetical protein
MKCKCPHSEARRLAARAVKGAEFAFIEAKRGPLRGEAGGSGAGFQREGQDKRTNLANLFSFAV